jgi:membrane peptidoglycan carboxypeptidase
LRDIPPSAEVCDVVCGHNPAFYRNGKILYENQQAPQRVLDEKTAYTIVKLLQGVVDMGTGLRLRYRYKFTQEIGGKTGTTQNQSDGWFMGITPNLVTGVWVGAQDRRMRFTSIAYGQGANMALPIWTLYMKGVYGDSRISLPHALNCWVPSDPACADSQEGRVHVLSPPALARRRLSPLPAGSQHVLPLAPAPSARLNLPGEPSSCGARPFLETR